MRPVLGDGAKPPAGQMSLRGSIEALNRRAMAAPHARIGAIYAARGAPTKWQPKTKPNHRRKVRPHVWV